jgi:hypothetical protein
MREYTCGMGKSLRPLYFCALFLASVFPCQARLIEYAKSIDRADAVAVVTTTAYTQTYEGGLIRQGAVLTVDIAVVGISVGEKINVSFGVPYDPNGRSRAFQSDSMDFSSPGKKHLVLLKREKAVWSVSRDSSIIENNVLDGYFSQFAGINDEVPLDKAIELIRAYFKTKSTASTPK